MTLLIRPAGDRDDPTDAVYRKILWRLMPFLVICYVCAFVDRSNIGFAKLQFVRDLNLTEAQYGFGAGIFYLGYMLCEVPSNLYLAAKGIRRTLVRIMVLWGLCVAAMALMQTATQFYILRGLLGAAEAGFFPGILLYLTYWVPAARRGRVTSLFMFAIPISGIVGGPLSASIMAVFDGVRGYAGWQWMFLLQGIPSSLLGVAAYFYLTDSPRAATWLTDAEKAVVERDLANERQQKAGRSHQSLGPALRDPRIYLLAVMAFALFASIGGVFFWLPTILRNAGIASLWQIGLLSAIPFGVGAAGQFLNGRDSDRRLERRWHTVVPALVAAAGWAALPWVTTEPVLALVMLTLVSAGTLASMVPFWTMPAGLLSGTAAAAGIALITSAGSTGNFISPIIVGWVANATGSLAAGQYYLAALMLLGATAILRIGMRETRGPAVHPSAAPQRT